jgi:hypothetical protein
VAALILFVSGSSTYLVLTSCLPQLTVRLCGTYTNVTTIILKLSTPPSARNDRLHRVCCRHQLASVIALEAHPSHLHPGTFHGSNILVYKHAGQQLGNRVCSVSLNGLAFTSTNPARCQSRTSSKLTSPPSAFYIRISNFQNHVLRGFHRLCRPRHLRSRPRALARARRQGRPPPAPLRLGAPRHERQALRCALGLGLWQPRRRRHHAPARCFGRVHPVA